MPQSQPEILPKSLSSFGVISYFSVNNQLFCKYNFKMQNIRKIFIWQKVFGSDKDLCNKSAYKRKPKQKINKMES